MYRPSNFPQNLSISVLHLNNFHLTHIFLLVFSHIYAKFMLAYSLFIVMWLFSLILVPVELFLIHFQRYMYVLTGNSVSNPKFRFGF